MVDFNNETTVTRPASDVVKMTILEQRYNALNALQWFKEQQSGGARIPLGKLAAPVLRLFFELFAILEGRVDKERLAALEASLLNPESDIELLEALRFLEQEIYKLGLTKIDTGKVYDKTRVETENKVKGL